MERAMDDHGAERGAALPRRAEAAEERSLDRQVEVGVGHDHERVLAPELEAGRLQVAAAELADPRAHLGRAGEADLVHEALLESALEARERRADRKSTRLNSSHANISYAVFCL